MAQALLGRESTRVKRFSFGVGLREEALLLPSSFLTVLVSSGVEDGGEGKPACEMKQSFTFTFIFIIVSSSSSFIFHSSFSGYPGWCQTFCVAKDSLELMILLPPLVLG